MLEPLQTAGPLCSTDITPLPRYYRPSRIPLAFHRLPGGTGYTASCSAATGTAESLPAEHCRYGTRDFAPIESTCNAIRLLSPHPLPLDNQEVRM